MQIIYVDESQPSGSINYFIIALLVIKDIQSLRVIKYAIADLRKGKKKAIKGAQLVLKDKIEFVEKIKKADYEVYGLVFENCFQKTDGNFKSNVIGLLLNKNDSDAILSQLINEHEGKTYVVFDQHASFYKFLTDYYEGKFDYIQNSYKRSRHELMDNYIKCRENGQGMILQIKKPRIVERKDGNLIEGIVAVDIFANAIKKKYADDKDAIFNLFSCKIKSIQRITYQGGTLNVNSVISEKSLVV